MLVSALSNIAVANCAPVDVAKIKDIRIHTQQRGKYMDCRDLPACPVGEYRRLVLKSPKGGLQQNAAGASYFMQLMIVSPA